MKNFIPKIIIDLLLVGTLIGVPILSLSGYAVLSQKKINDIAITTTITPQKNPFEDINLFAKSAIVFDIQKNKILYSKNANAPLPLASLNKLMTSVVALENSSSDTALTFQNEYLKEEGDSGLKPGEIWNLKKLIQFTLVASSNDGARAVASAIQALKPSINFMDQMNLKAQSLQLTSMRFNNPTGLDMNGGEAGGYGSAQDVAKLLEYILRQHPEILELTKESNIVLASSEIRHMAVNTDTIVDSVPGIIGSKTGYSDLAGGNLAIIVDAGIDHTIALVVLGSSYDGRFKDMKQLASSLYAYLALEK